MQGKLTHNTSSKTTFELYKDGKILRYQLFPRELTGASFEYLLKQKLITQKTQYGFINLVFEDKIPNFILHSGKVGGTDYTKTRVKSLSLPESKTTDNKLIRTQTVKSDIGEHIFRTEATYLARLTEIVNYLHQHYPQNSYDWNQFKLTPFKVTYDVKSPVFALPGNNMGDIHQIMKHEDNIAFVKIRSRTIFHNIKIKDNEYLIVGYPDYFKMPSHEADINNPDFNEIILRYESNDTDNSNCRLLCQLSNLIGNTEMTKEEINAQQSLWKITDMKHPELMYIQKHFPELYEEQLEIYKTEINNYIQQHQCLQQCPIRIKYNFQIFKLVDGKYQILANSLQNLLPEHISILEEINRFIKQKLYQLHLHNKTLSESESGSESESESRMVHCYVSLSGFFHIKAEFLNPLTNYFIFEYETYNSIKLEELIYSLQYTDFWKNADYTITVPVKKLQPIIQHNEQLQQGGNPDNLIDRSIILDETCHIVLFNNEHNMDISSVIYKDGKFILLKMSSNKIIILNDAKFEFMKDVKEAQSTGKLYLDDYFGSKVEMIHLSNQYSYKINRLEYIHTDSKIAKEIFDMFFKDKIPIVYSRFPATTLKQMSQLKTVIPIDQILDMIPPFIKTMILYHCLTEKTNTDKNIIELKEKLLKHHIDTAGQEKYQFNVFGDDIRKIKFGKYTGIMYQKNEVSIEVNQFKYLLWIVPNVLYDHVENLLDETLQLTENLFEYLKKEYLDAVLLKSQFDGFLRYVYDVDATNYRDIISIMDMANVMLKEGKTLNMFIHQVAFFYGDCLHMKIGFDDFIHQMVDKDKYINYYSRSISYDRFKSFINAQHDYYSNGIICHYGNIEWRFIFLNLYYKQQQQMKLENKRGGGNQIISQNIQSLDEYKKKIYTSMTHTYDDYLKIINLTDINRLRFNTEILPNNNNTTKLVNNLEKIIKVDKLHTGALTIALITNQKYNTGNMALIISSINVIRVINQLSKVNQFDVFLNKGNLPLDNVKQFESELKNMKCVRNIYGSYKTDDIDSYPQLAMKYSNMYNNVSVMNASTIFTKYPTIFTVCDLPKVYMKTLLGLHILKDNGNMYIYFKASFQYPLLKQYFDILTYLFDDVEITPMNFNKYNLDIHCTKFNRNKFNIHQHELYQLLEEIGHHWIDGTEYKSILNNKVFYNNGIKNGKSINIAYNLNISIPSSTKTKKLITQIETQYYAFLEDINHKIEQYIPVTNNGISHILDTLICNYVSQLINISKQHGLPYDKYYLTLLDNSYENIYQKMFDLDNTISLKLTPPHRSLSLKRTRKSKTKYNTSNRISKDVKSHKPYQYTQFKEHIDKLDYTKKNQEVQLDKYGKSKMKIINKIMDDFNDGISKYLHTKFNTEISPDNNFLKLWEIYSTFGLITNKKTIRTFHIGEAPGTFIKATQYYINRKCPKNTEFLWKANCFNPYNKEMKKKYGSKLFGDDYDLIKDNKSDWLWGGDDTGEITKAKHIRWYRIYLDAWLDGQPLDVVTCNSSLKSDATSLEKQKLDFSHFLMTATTTTPNKHCVNRCYTHFLGNSNYSGKNVLEGDSNIEASGFFINLLYLYNMVFKEVHLIKPFTSKATNGEFYIVGKYFTELPEDTYQTLLDILDKDHFELNQTFFDVKDIPDKFIVQVTKFIEEIVELNVQSIERQLFFLSCSHDDGEISQKTNCKHYLDSKNLDKIHREKYYKWVQMFKFR